MGRKNCQVLTIRVTLPGSVAATAYLLKTNYNYSVLDVNHSSGFFLGTVTVESAFVKQISAQNSAETRCQFHERFYPSLRLSHWVIYESLSPTDFHRRGLS